jgi:hypothetical protein
VGNTFYGGTEHITQYWGYTDGDVTPYSLVKAQTFRRSLLPPAFIPKMTKDKPHRKPLTQQRVKQKHRSERSDTDSVTWPSTSASEQVFTVSITCPWHCTIAHHIRRECCSLRNKQLSEYIPVTYEWLLQWLLRPTRSCGWVNKTTYHLKIAR